MTKDTNAPSVLIVGAGGFIGGFIASEGLRRGYRVWAGVRQSTSRRYLQDPDINFIEFDYDDPAQIRHALQENAPDGQPWDYIVYNLGATKCANFADFNRINYLYLRSFVEEMRKCQLMPRRFLFMSSLSALGPYGEKNGCPATACTIPHPNTRYGLSKIKAETYLETCPELPWIIFRPTGVYGPHEQDYLMMIKCIDSHLDVSMGFRPQKITFIYVEDLVNAIYDALPVDATTHRKYILSEDRAYTQKEFRTLVAKRLGHKFVFPLTLPMWAVFAVSFVAEKWAAVSLKPSTLNRDKFKIMKQRNWTCSIADAFNDFGFKIDYPLERGVNITVDEYLRNKALEKAKKK